MINAFRSEEIELLAQLGPKPVTLETYVIRNVKLNLIIYNIHIIILKIMRIERAYYNTNRDVKELKYL